MSASLLIKGTMLIKSIQAEAVIPPRSQRKIPRDYNQALYKARNLIKRRFTALKHFRRVATRYDKLDIAYLSFAFLTLSSGDIKPEHKASNMDGCKKWARHFCITRRDAPPTFQMKKGIFCKMPPFINALILTIFFGVEWLESCLDFHTDYLSFVSQALSASTCPAFRPSIRCPA